MTIFFFEMLNEVVKSFEKCYLSADANAQVK